MTRDQALLAATAGGLFRVDLAGGDPVPEIERRDLTALSPDGRWALVEGRELLRRDESGWSTAAAVDAELSGESVVAVGGEVYAGTSRARLLRLRDGALEAVEGFDAVEGRDGWYTPWGGPPDTRSLSASADGALYANVHVGGIPRSRDGGETWEPTIDVDADVHQVLADPDRDGVVWAATALGPARSDDAGETWQFLTDGLHATYSRGVALAGDRVLASVSESHVGRRAAIYRAPRDGGAFQRCTEGVPEWFDRNIDTGWLVARGDVAAFTSPGGDLYVSRDAGGSWSLRTNALPPPPRWLAFST